jgi:hypothetical protein
VPKLGFEDLDVDPGGVSMKMATLFLAVVLAGCVSSAERAARDDSECQSYGAKPGSDLYVQCRLGVAKMRNDRIVAAIIAP